MPSSYTGNPANGHRAPAVVMPYVSDGEAASSENLAQDSKRLADQVAWLQAHSAIADDNNTYSGTNTFNGPTNAAAVTASGALSVGGQATVDAAGANDGNIANTIRLGAATSGEGIGSKRTAGGNSRGLDLYTNSAARLSITQSGVIDCHGNALINVPNPVNDTDVANKAFVNSRFVVAGYVDLNGNLLNQGGAITVTCSRIATGAYRVNGTGFSTLSVIVVSPASVVGGPKVATVFPDGGGFTVYTWLPGGAASDNGFTFFVARL